MYWNYKMSEHFTLLKWLGCEMHFSVLFYFFILFGWFLREKKKSKALLRSGKAPRQINFQTFRLRQKTIWHLFSIESNRKNQDGISSVAVLKCVKSFWVDSNTRCKLKIKRPCSTERNYSHQSLPNFMEQFILYIEEQLYGLFWKYYGIRFTLQRKSSENNRIYITVLLWNNTPSGKTWQRLMWLGFCFSA